MNLELNAIKPTRERIIEVNDWLILETVFTYQ